MKVFKCKEKHSNNYSKELYWSSPKSKMTSQIPRQQTSVQKFWYETHIRENKIEKPKNTRTTF